MDLYHVYVLSFSLFLFIVQNHPKGSLCTSQKMAHIKNSKHTTVVYRLLRYPSQTCLVAYIILISMCNMSMLGTRWHKGTQVHV